MTLSLSLAGFVMPVYLLTFHSYLSWLPDRPEGYVKPKRGVLPTDEAMARGYRNRATSAPVFFTDEQGWELIDLTRELALTEEWLLYQIAATSTHVHVLLGWKDDRRASQISNLLKRMFGQRLSQLANRPGPWFSRGKSQKRIFDRDHFRYLKRRYLPDHGEVCLSKMKSRKPRSTEDPAPNNDQPPQSQGK